MLRDNEKLIAFIFLIIAILALVLLASTFDRGAANDIVVQGKLRIIDSAVAGLLTIAGMCAQALFKISNSERQEIGKAVSEAIQNGPPVPTEVQNSKNKPVPIDDAPLEPVVDELPEYAQ